MIPQNKGVQCNKHNLDEDLAIKLYQDGKTLEYIGNLLNVSYGCIGYRLKKRGIKIRKCGNAIRHKDYLLNSRFFEKIDSHEKATIFGFICADGYNDRKSCRIKISIHSKDRDYLEKINSYIQPKKPNPIKDIEVTTKAGNITYNSTMHIGSSYMCDDLIRLGCGPNKSLTLEFPTVPEEFLCSFFAGYFDGDGCITFTKKKEHYKRGYSIEIASSHIFCPVAKEKIEKTLGITAFLCLKNKISTVRIGGNNQVEKFMDWIYSKTPIKLNRKYQKYLEMKRHFDEHGRRKTTGSRIGGRIGGRI